MNDLGIIFVHHATSPTTAGNLELLRRFNPDAEIVTVSQDGEDFPGGYNTKDLFDGPWNTYRMKFNEYGWRNAIFGSRKQLHRGFVWRNAELALYQWYTHKKEQAKRWLVAEWDMLCLERAETFYEAVWDADVAAANVKTLARTPDWSHFAGGGIESLPEEHRERAMGLTPLAGLLFSDAALREISFRVRDDARWRGVFCELRLGTVANILGLKAVEISERAKVTLSDVEEYKAAEIREPGMWHKVKDHVLGDARVRGVEVNS